MIRFGLAQVDYETLARTRRKSWHYYRECIANNTAVP
jgi:beta-glucosidase/6-phospho-beta-glucosidase/beta-galactosidase